MSLSDKAFEGKLTLSELQQYLSTNRSSLNAIGGQIDLTPLCAACSGGRFDVVKHLLHCNADPNIPSAYDRTPLFFVLNPDSRSNVSSSTRCAIIRELVSGKSSEKADLNKACDDDKNTPLMNAILQLKDKAVIRQLVESGASVDIEHPDTKMTAKQLAEEHGLSDALTSKADKDQAWNNLVQLVVSFVLLVVAYANNKTLNKVVGGVAKKYYNISVKEADLPKDLKDKVEPKSIDDFKNFLNDEVKGGKFGKFFSPNDPFLVNLAKKAYDLKSDPNSDLGKPENIKKLTQLSLYHPVIYCDDSGSMNHGSPRRYEYQTQLVARIAAIATKIVPDDWAGVDLRFINHNHSARLTAQEILDTMSRIPVEKNNLTAIGTNLREKILQPLVYDVIDQPRTTGNPIPFKRPLLVCIITDGEPYPEKQETLRDEIVACKKRLEDKGYDPTSVMFCISQVGDNKEAKTFIEGLSNEKEIKDVIYCTAGQLDKEFEKFKQNERALESWLLHLLTKPIMGTD